MDLSFREALQRAISQVTGSDVFLQIWHPSMADFKADPWPAIQLAIAVLSDKPILVVCPPGRHLPWKLRAIADEVISGSTPEEWAEAAREWTARHDKPQHGDWPEDA